MPSSGYPSRAISDARRLETLDGLRCIAALMVLSYHFIARWTTDKHGKALYSYGDSLYEAFPVSMHFGTFGVSLFFLISGFVIMMTLRNSSGLIEFAFRRMIRLWPTMIVCATLTTILVNASGIHERFEGVDHWPVNALEFASSILFIDPELTGRVLGIEGLSWVDGVYWTLWVEVRFYALIAIIYAMSGDRNFGMSWLALQVCSTLSLAIAIWAPNGFNRNIGLILQPDYLFWFTIGISAYFAWLKKLSLPIILSAIVAVAGATLSAVSEAGHDQFLSVSGYLVLYGCVATIFLLVTLKGYFSALLSSKALVTIGLASYPLYMFHDRAGIILTTLLADLGINPITAMLVVVMTLLLFAICIHRFVEVRSKKFLQSRGMSLAHQMQLLVPALSFNRSADHR